MIRINNAKVLKYIRSNQDISKLFKYYIEHNTSFDLPYHNMNHAFEIMGHIINIYEKQYISDQELYLLLISALFHDFNHSGGLFNDSINVHHAKMFLHDALQEVLSEDLRNSELIEIECSKIIDATEYPYAIPDNELTFLQQIIRECDILVTLYDDFLTQSLMGIKSEMHSKNTIETLANYVKFLLETYNNLSLEYSKEVINENQESILGLIEDLYAILK